jgi:hypothetical protein
MNLQPLEPDVTFRDCYKKMLLGMTDELEVK